MRCNNCGFENEPGVRTCVKCRCELSEQPVMGYGNYNSRPSYGDSELKQTRIINENVQPQLLKQTVVQGANWNAQEKKTQIQMTCPRCHEVMIGNYCSNCGYEMQPEKTAAVKNDVLDGLTNKCQNCGKDVPLTFHYCPDCGAKIEAQTINPFKDNSSQRIEEPAHICSLTPIDVVEGEMIDGKVQEYEGNSVILNRENTDPGNRTITSKEQAELIYEEDGWALLNRSDYGATLVAANRKISLQSGDVIMLGNKRFRFDVKQ